MIYPKIDWMSAAQQRDFEQICDFIDTIKSPKEFYSVMEYINNHFNTDVINCAREIKRCYNSAQYM